MGSLSDVYENRVIDALFGNNRATALTSATVYVALYTVAPTDAGGGTQVPFTNGYTRAAVTNNSTNWPNAAASTKPNGTEILFPTATGAGWGTIVAWGIFDDPTGGNLICWGDLAVNRTIAAGEAPFFAPGEIDLTAD